MSHDSLVIVRTGCVIIWLWIFIRRITGWAWPISGPEGLQVHFFVSVRFIVWHQAQVLAVFLQGPMITYNIFHYIVYRQTGNISFHLEKLFGQELQKHMDFWSQIVQSTPTQHDVFFQPEDDYKITYLLGLLLWKLWVKSYFCFHKLSQLAIDQINGYLFSKARFNLVSQQPAAFPHTSALVLCSDWNK